MEFDPVGSAEHIPAMIKNDTLIEVLDADQLSECLKHIKLNFEESMYVLDKIKAKYKLIDRFKAVHHIFTDFCEGEDFDTNKFFDFLVAFGKCLHIDILSQLPESKKINKNIITLKLLENATDCFDKVYEVFSKIASENDKEAMQFAIENDFYKIEDEYGRNILTNASYNDNLQLVRFLVESNIDVNMEDDAGNTALIYAVDDGNIEIVKYLITVPGINVNATNGDGQTPLMKASEHKNEEVVKLLLSVPGIDVNAKDDDKYTALMYASFRTLQSDDDEVVKCLLSVPGIDVNARNDDEMTAYMIAKRNFKPKVVKLLKAFPGIDTTKGNREDDAKSDSEDTDFDDILEMDSDDNPFGIDDLSD